MCHCDDNNFNIVVCGKTNKRVTGTGIWVIFIVNPFLNQEVYILCVEEIKGRGGGVDKCMGKVSINMMLRYMMCKITLRWRVNFHGFESGILIDY